VLGGPDPTCGTNSGGTGTSAAFTTTSKHVSIAAWTFDKTGNIGTRSVVHLS
jgi:hypothetical protein